MQFGLHSYDISRHVASLAFANATEMLPLFQNDSRVAIYHKYSTQSEIATGHSEAFIIHTLSAGLSHLLKRGDFCSRLGRSHRSKLPQGRSSQQMLLTDCRGDWFALLMPCQCTIVFTKCTMVTSLHIPFAKVWRQSIRQARFRRVCQT